jgi:hypothetical protein
MWELQPVELVARARPPLTAEHPLQTPELSIFRQEHVDEAVFRGWLRSHNLALAVSRDVTSRDDADRQQPFNLQVDGGTAQTLGATGKIWSVKYLQFVQGDFLRGTNGDPGRRVLGQFMHGLEAINPPVEPASPQGSTILGPDGSMASFVPARRPMAWQLTDDAGEPVVIERVWLSFQPGEIRVCASCHGVNTLNQAGLKSPTNPPEALRTLLRHWKTLPN